MKYLIGIVSVIGIVLMPIVADASVSQNNAASCSGTLITTTLSYTCSGTQDFPQVVPFAYLEGSGGQMSYSLNPDLCINADIELFEVYHTLPLDFTGAYTSIYSESIDYSTGHEVMIKHTGHYLLRATCTNGPDNGVVFQIPYFWQTNTDEITYSINGTNLRIYSEHGTDIGGECTYYDTSMNPQETIGSSPTFCEFDLTSGVVTLPAYFGVDNTTLGNVYVPAILPNVGSSTTTPLYTHGDFTQPELLAGIFLAVLCMFLVMWSFRKS